MKYGVLTQTAGGAFAINQKGLGVLNGTAVLLVRVNALYTNSYDIGCRVFASPAALDAREQHLVEFNMRIDDKVHSNKLATTPLELAISLACQEVKAKIKEVNPEIPALAFSSELRDVEI